VFKILLPAQQTRSIYANWKTWLFSLGPDSIVLRAKQAYSSNKTKLHIL
jgi:hypothetical protein